MTNLLMAIFDHTHSTSMFCAVEARVERRSSLQSVASKADVDDEPLFCFETALKTCYWCVIDCTHDDARPAYRHITGLPETQMRCCTADKSLMKADTTRLRYVSSSACLVNCFAGPSLCIATRRYMCCSILSWLPQLALIWHSQYAVCLQQTLALCCTGGGARGHPRDSHEAVSAEGVRAGMRDFTDLLVVNCTATMTDVCCKDKVAAMQHLIRTLL
jgi:hypothetical protein